MDPKTETTRKWLLALNDLPRADLELKWTELFGTAAPKFYGTQFLRKRLAFRIQEVNIGGLTRESKRAVIQAAKKRKTKSYVPRSKLQPGLRIVRRWHNREYVVTVRINGFEYSGKLYRTLTAVASAITGYHQNGNKFFGVDSWKKQLN